MESLVISRLYKSVFLIDHSLYTHNFMVVINEKVTHYGHNPTCKINIVYKFFPDCPKPFLV